MNEVEILLAAEYESALDSEAPPSAVNIEVARARGRTLRRRHRTALTGSGLLAVALAALITVTLLPGVGFGHGSTGVAASGENYSGESYPPADDPLATRITFGWLPDGVSVAGATTQYPDIGDTTAGGAGMRFTAFVEPRGRQLAEFCPASAVTQYPTAFTTGNPKAKVMQVGPPCDAPAPAVNGRPAHWVTAPGSNGVVTDGVVTGGVSLVWQYADGATAELGGILTANMSAATVSQLMHRIAENMHVSRFQAVPMPFHLAQMPAGWHFENADWIAGPQGAQVGANLGEASAHLSIGVGTTGPGSGEIQVSEYPATAAFPTDTELKAFPFAGTGGHSQALTVDGHPARMVTSSDHTALMVHDVNGLDVIVAAIDPAALAFAGSTSGIIAYFHTITVLGPDRAAWTTHVLG